MTKSDRSAAKPLVFSRKKVQKFWQKLVPEFEKKSISLELLCARFADGCRDIQIMPPHPDSFQKETSGFSEEAKRRLALLIASFDLEDFRPILKQSFQNQNTETLFQNAFLKISREKELLTMELLRKSTLRIEELLRNFFLALEISIEGESKKELLENLQRLDYERLLKETELVKEKAKEERERLRKLQEKKRVRRGKW